MSRKQLDSSVRVPPQIGVHRCFGGPQVLRISADQFYGPVEKPQVEWKRIVPGFADRSDPAAASGDLGKPNPLSSSFLDTTPALYRWLDFRIFFRNRMDWGVTSTSSSSRMNS
ncbi:MAG TPA: hypothetical protein VG345_13305, partial [Bryobacteraceae bacterium]|nr:hypothetical protein [Bryobacteraceae bacterium]